MNPFLKRNGKQAVDAGKFRHLPLVFFAGQAAVSPAGWQVAAMQ
jgi:hypothetical protein